MSSAFAAACQPMPTDDNKTDADTYDPSAWEIVQPESTPRQPKRSGCFGCFGCLLAILALFIVFFALGGMGIAAIGAVLGIPEVLVAVLVGLALWGGVRLLAWLRS